MTREEFVREHLKTCRARRCRQYDPNKRKVSWHTLAYSRRKCAKSIWRSRGGKTPPRPSRGKRVAQISLGEAKWRMLRRALVAPQPFRFEAVREWAALRYERKTFDRLVRLGMFIDTGGGFYRLSPAGREAADLGYYDPAAEGTKCRTK